MTYSGDLRDAYANQEQQDDYFSQDLAIARHDVRDNSRQDNQAIKDSQNQGQQDDYFDQDLSQSDHGE